MKKINFWGFPFQLFLFVIFCIWSYLFYDGFFRCTIPNVNNFTIVNKYQNANVHKHSIDTEYRILCTNDLGSFDIKMNYSAYSNAKIGSNLSLETYPDVHDLLLYSDNKETRNNIINNIDNSLYRFFYDNTFLFIIITMVYLIFFLFELFIITTISYNSIYYIANKIFNF